MTQRLAPLLLLLAACGAGGVCAGCGGDDGDDVPPARVSFTATWESSTAPPPSHCTGNPTVALAITGFDAAAPMAAGRTCAAVVDDGSTWLLSCAGNVAMNQPRIDVRLDKGLEDGTETLFAVDGSCSDTYRMTSITVE